MLAEKGRKNVEISWLPPKQIFLDDGSSHFVLDHKEAVHTASFHYLPAIAIVIPQKKITSYIIKDIIYEELVEEEFIIIQEQFQKNHDSLLEIKYQVKVPISYLYIPTVKWDPLEEKFLKIKSFELEYNTDQQPLTDNNFRTRQSTSSVLTTGKWYKFAVAEKGIYKISYEKLKSVGVPVDEINPKNIKIFGNGGGMLPQKNSETRYEDIVENAIYVSGEEDGKFSSEDYLLFYGQSPDYVSFDINTDSFLYSKNVYSDSCYYFLTVDGEPGLRIPLQENLGNDFAIVDRYNDYIVHESDLVTAISSGREWYGERFQEKADYTFDFTITDIVDNTDIKIASSLLSFSLNPSSYSLFLNDFPVGTTDFPPIQEGQYLEKGKEKIDIFTLNSSLINVNEGLSFKINYQKQSNWGLLNYFILSFERNLSLTNKQTFFRSKTSLQSSNATYQIENVAENDKIWDLTDPLRPINQEFSISNNTALFGSSSTELKNWVVFNPQELFSPTFIREVPNQNLKGEGTFDMVIITHKSLLLEAQRLADFRSSGDQLSVKVVTVEEIYNEFSSGAKDITAIRDYMRHLYNQDEGIPKLKYLLLFGKGSFDIRDKTPGNINLVPLYLSRNSLHPIYSYSSDDYYAFLDDDEGEWLENADGDHLMDLNVGRIPVRDINEAKVVVDKIIYYSTNLETYGRWRKEITFVADDGDLNLHQNDADKLATLVDTTYSDFNVQKIYMDAYPQVRTGTQKKYAPEVNDAINDAIKNGVLIMNFTGHGGMNVWTHEEILTTDMIMKWDNMKKLPLFVTATCNFGQHDDATERSAGEKLLLSSTGGAIALVTSSRPVFSSTNYALNFAFYNFAFKKVDGQYPTLGEIFKETKNNSLKGSVNRNFSLLGDPSMKLAYPQNDIVITSITNHESLEKTDTLKALSRVKIAGKIINHLKDTLETFNGYLFGTIYDKDKLTTTLSSPSMTFKEKSSYIFRGQATIKNGEYSLEFIVPKNISYNIDKGKISLYALDSIQKIDASGSSNKISVGGSSSSFPLDLEPPAIKLFMNDTTFRNGGITDANSLFLANIFDESGISIIQSVNQNITLTLNNGKEIILNNFYEAEADSYKNGWISYPINDLPVGRNMIKLKVWDSYNNSSEAELEFFVEEDAKLALANVMNFPNPFAGKTTFQLDHNAAGEDLEIILEIYSVKGEQIYSFATQFSDAPSRINVLEWDGRNNSGSYVKEGIYIYKLMVHSKSSGLKNQKYKRLIILK